MTIMKQDGLTTSFVRRALIGAVLLGTAAAAKAQGQVPPAAKGAPAAAAKSRAAAPAGVTTQAAAAPAPTTLPASGSGNSGKVSGDIVARVGGMDVSADELKSYVGALGEREQAALAKDPALLSQSVRLLLANRLVLQEAQAKKWDERPEIAAQLQRVRDSAIVELYLQSVTVAPAGFPSDDELQKTYDANRAAFLVPRQFELGQIFVALPQNADKAAEDKARKLLDEVQQKLRAPGADFAALAKSVTEANDGGEIGWVAENAIRPEIRALVIGLSKGGISEPIKLDDGWHILRLIDTKAAYTRTLPEVREALAQQMRTERAGALRRAYLAELLRQNPPVLNEFALSNLFRTTSK